MNNKITLGDFITNASAIQLEDESWTVYVDGKNKTGAIIMGCNGSNAFTAIEDAYEYYCDLYEEINK